MHGMSKINYICLVRCHFRLWQVDKQAGFLPFLKGAALNEGRGLFPGDREFGRWLQENVLSQVAIAPDDQAAAMWVARALNFLAMMGATFWQSPKSPARYPRCYPKPKYANVTWQD